MYNVYVYDLPTFDRCMKIYGSTSPRTTPIIFSGEEVFLSLPQRSCRFVSNTETAVLLTLAKLYTTAYMCPIFITFHFSLRPLRLPELTSRVKSAEFIVEWIT